MHPLGPTVTSTLRKYLSHGPFITLMLTMIHRRLATWTITAIVANPGVWSAPFRIMYVSSELCNMLANVHQTNILLDSNNPATRAADPLKFIYCSCKSISYWHRSFTQYLLLTFLFLVHRRHPSASTCWEPWKRWQRQWHDIQWNSHKSASHLGHKHARRRCRRVLSRHRPKVGINAHCAYQFRRVCLKFFFLVGCNERDGSC
jgi:hypothetical protein